MTSAYAIEAFVVLGVLVVVAAVAAGMGDLLAPAWRDARPLPLPAGRALTADDLTDARFTVAVRGYRMAEVDVLLDRLAAEVAARDAELATLRAALSGDPGDELADLVLDGQGSGATSGVGTAAASPDPRAEDGEHG